MPALLENAIYAHHFGPGASASWLMLFDFYRPEPVAPFDALSMVICGRLWKSHPPAWRNNDPPVPVGEGRRACGTRRSLGG
ncbi:MAG: hypothetical protein IPL58_10080 [Betaproteobacteria bacterium]|uniref:Uncharacterized protein n=1 Tax=Candidatus Proximibacter danicus TaxID=2954365 RepID=A0A9D7PRR0_9PROT|nr:hypothetical protein [Candidatus Proximibacter danicus]